jgi:hypothetical protein
MDGMNAAVHDISARLREGYGKALRNFSGACLLQEDADLDTRILIRF